MWNPEVQSLYILKKSTYQIPSIKTATSLLKTLPGNGIPELSYLQQELYECLANNNTNRVITYMWINESFICYSKGLFVEYWYGIAAGFEYLSGIRSNICNESKVNGIYYVNRCVSGDMCRKGANILLIISQIVNPNENWRGILRWLNKSFWYQTVRTVLTEGYMEEHTYFELKQVFDHVLCDIGIPAFE